MRIALVAVLLLASALAGCTSQEGNPDLRNNPADPLPSVSETDPPRRTSTTSFPTPSTTNTTAPPQDNATAPPVFEISVSGNVSGGAPTTVPLQFDIVSEHRVDGRQVFFTYTIDLDGDGQVDLSGDSRDFIAQDENGTRLYHEDGRPVHEPLSVNHTYDWPGIYNVTLRAQRFVADALEAKTAILVLPIQAGPTFDELCPTDATALQPGGYYVATDGTRWRETNGVQGLQRPDTAPDCPTPDSPA